MNVIKDIKPLHPLNILADIIFWGALETYVQESYEALKRSGLQAEDEHILHLAREHCLGEASREGWWPRAFRLPPKGWLVAPYRTSEEVWRKLVGHSKWELVQNANPVENEFTVRVVKEL